MSSNRMGLGELKKGQQGIIIGVNRNPSLNQEDVTPDADRMLEMGFVEGSRVEVVHESPFGGDPIAVRVRGTLIALRRHEANTVEVKLIGEDCPTPKVVE